MEMNAFDEFDDEMCFMICLYGIALPRADIVPLMGEVDEFFCAIGQPTSHISVRAPGFGRPPLRFGRAWKRLQKTAPEDLVSVHLYSLSEDWITSSDWIAIGSVFTALHYFHLGASLVAVPDAEQRIMELTRRWLDRMRPAYGIGFYRKRGRGPSAYGIGLSFGYRGVFFGPELEESRAVNRWSDGMDAAVYDQGILRDVYPYQLLTARHLERPVDATAADTDTDDDNHDDRRALRDWIRAEPWRGRLSECEHGYTLWTVEREHEPRVRRRLAAAGALYVLDRENHL